MKLRKIISTILINIFLLGCLSKNSYLEKLSISKIKGKEEIEIEYARIKEIINQIFQEEVYDPGPKANVIVLNALQSVMNDLLSLEEIGVLAAKNSVFQLYVACIDLRFLARSSTSIYKLINALETYSAYPEIRNVFYRNLQDEGSVRALIENLLRLFLYEKEFVKERFGLTIVTEDDCILKSIETLVEEDKTSVKFTSIDKVIIYLKKMFSNYSDQKFKNNKNLKLNSEPSELMLPIQKDVVKQNEEDKIDKEAEEIVKTFIAQQVYASSLSSTAEYTLKSLMKDIISLGRLGALAAVRSGVLQLAIGAIVPHLSQSIDQLIPALELFLIYPEVKDIIDKHLDNQAQENMEQILKQASDIKKASSSATKVEEKTKEEDDNGSSSDSDSDDETNLKENDSEIKELAEGIERKIKGEFSNSNSSISLTAARRGKGFKITIPISRVNNIIIRIMRRGSFREFYYRICFKRGGSVDINGFKSHNPEFTHIPLVNNSYETIINVIKKLLGGK